MSASLVEEKKGLPGGVIITDTGKKVNILDRKEDNYWDTIIIGDRVQAYQIPAAHSLEFFKNVSTKGKQFSVFETDNKIVANEQILVTKVGLVPRLFWGDTRSTSLDIKKCLDAAYCDFRKNDNAKKYGPPIFWQAGYGYAGSTVESNDFFLSIGVPSPAAIPDLLKPFELYDTDRIEATMRWPNSTMQDSSGQDYEIPEIDTPVAVTLVLHGFIVRSGLRD